MSVIKASIIVDDSFLRRYEELIPCPDGKLQKEAEAKFGKEILLVLYTNWLRSDADAQSAECSKEVSIDLAHNRFNLALSFSKIEADTIISYCEEDYDRICRYYGSKIIDALKEACKNGEN